MVVVAPQLIIVFTRLPAQVRSDCGSSGLYHSEEGNSSGTNGDVTCGI
jgi:hypothetical protein